MELSRGSVINKLKLSGVKYMNFKTLIVILFVGSITSVISVAFAVFDASISPPKFEFKADAGDVIRQVINIQNMSKEVAKFKVHTEDWDYTDNNTNIVYFAGPPKANSCRPWTRIERHSVAIAGGGEKPYRFEIHVPKNTKPMSCHFAIIVSPDPSTITPTKIGGMSMPIVGRIAVTIYVTVGGAKPVLQLKKISMGSYQGESIPVVVMSNSGTAYARTSGVLQAKDSKNRKVELWVGALPILPKQTREIPLYPMDWSSGNAQKASFTLEPPIHVRGELEWGDAKTKLDQIIY